MSRSFDDDLGFKIGGTSQPMVEELRRLRAEFVATIDLAKKLQTVTGGAARRAGGVTGGGTGRAAGDDAAKAAAKAARDEQQAWAKALKEQERQRRELAKISAQLYRDQEREALRAIRAETGARREAGRIAGQMYRDQERNAKRAAATEAKAAKDAAAEKTRADRAAAREAEKLRRTEERALKDFGGAMRRETAARYADQDKAAKAALSAEKRRYQEEAAAAKRAGEATARDSATLWTGLKVAIVAAAVAAAAFAAIVAKITFDAFKQFVLDGIKFNQTMESARLSIASLIASFYEIKTTSGGTLTGMEKLNAALGISKGLTKEIQIAALQTNVTTSQLVEIYNQALAAANRSQLPLKAVLPLTVKLTQAAGALGIQESFIGQQVRQILQGNITIRTQLAAGLGIKKEELNEWIKQGKLEDELNKKLVIFGIAGAVNQKTFAGLTSNLQDAYEIIAGMASSKLFDRLKEAASIILPALFNFEQYGLQPKIASLVGFIDDSLGKFGYLIVEVTGKAIDGLNQIGTFVERNKVELSGIVDLSIELLRQIGNLVVVMFETASLLHLTTTNTKEWGDNLSTVRIIIGTIGLFVAATADGIANIGHFALQVKGAIMLGIYTPLAMVLDLAAKILDVFSNVGAALKGWGGSVASAGAALSSGDFAGAFTAIQNTPDLSDLGASSAMGDEVRSWAATAKVYANENAKLARSYNFTTDAVTHFNLVMRGQAGGSVPLYAKGGEGLVTAPGGGGGGDLDKAAAGNNKAAQAAKKFSDAIEKVSEDIKTMRAELGLTAPAYEELLNRLNSFNAKVKEFSADPRKYPDYFKNQATEIGKMLQAGGVTGKAGFIDNARELAVAADIAIGDYAKGISVSTKSGLEVIKPTADQVIAFAQATHEKLALQYAGLIRTSMETVAGIEARTKEMTDSLAGGADNAAKKWADLQAEIEAVNKTIDASHLDEGAARSSKRRFAEAATGVFTAEQANKAAGYWDQVHKAEAAGVADTADRRLEAIKAQGEAFKTLVDANIKDESEAAKIVNAYKTALMQGYWNEEKKLANDVANTEKELANRLLVNDQERIKAGRELNALRAAQAIDPGFDPTKPRTGFEAPGTAEGAFNQSMTTASAENIAGITEKLFDQFKNISSGALPAIMDAKNIAEAARIMEEYGITLERVAGVYTDAATSSGEYLAHVKALAKAQDTSKPINTTTVAMKQLIKTTFTSQQAFVGFGMAAGEALAGLITGSEDAGTALKRFFFNLIGDLAIQFGTLAIAAGTAANAMPWFGLTGVAAVVAGIALVTLGATFKALAGAAGGGASAAAGGGTGGAAAGGSAAPPEQKETKVPRHQFNTTGEQGFAIEWHAAPGADGRLVRLLLEELERAGMVSTRTMSRGSTRNLVKRRS